VLQAEQSLGFRDYSDPIAIIDIGSNSVRLLVYEGCWRSAPPLYNEKVLCGLGRTLSTTHSMSEESIDRAHQALARFRAIADQLGAKKISAVATAAAREATNGAEFIKNAETILGVPITILTGKREAALAAKGVMAGLYNADGIAGDLGGGSLELINIRDGKLLGGATTPLGGLRLIDNSGNKIGKAAQLIDREIENLDWLEQGAGRPFYAIGGTWRAFAKLHMAQYNYPLRVMHGYSIPTDNTLSFAKLIKNLSPASLEGIERVAKARRDTVPFGALVLERLITRMKPSEIIISAYGLREGLLYEQLSDRERKKDILIALCEDLANLRSRSPRHARELCKWTDPLFKKPNFKETLRERRLRHAACLVSDIGWRSHTEYRAEHCLNMIAQGTMAGVDHSERVTIALSIYFRHIGIVKRNKVPEIARLVTDRQLKHAQMIGAAIRTAHMISASMPNVIVNTPIFYDQDRLVLQLPPPYNILQGERLARRLKSMASLVGCNAEIRSATGSHIQNDSDESDNVWLKTRGVFESFLR